GGSAVVPPVTQRSPYMSKVKPSAPCVSATTTASALLVVVTVAGSKPSSDAVVGPFCRPVHTTPLVSMIEYMTCTVVVSPARTQGLGWSTVGVYAVRTSVPGSVEMKAVTVCGPAGTETSLEVVTSVPVATGPTTTMP